MATSYDYLIIGSGIFGASTAYHLIEKYPKARIGLVDRMPYPCPLAASWDWNKVVRADYGEAFYMKVALEAMEVWRNNPLFKPFYHESGLINIDNTGLGRKMIENYKSLKTDIKPELVNSQQLNERYKAFFEKTDFTDVDEIYINTRSGWAQADKALKAVIDESVTKGVQYLETELAQLKFDEGGKCVGFEDKNGTIHTAKKTVLATGAETAKVLADSAPKNDAIHAKHRLTAAAVVVGNTKLSPQEAEKYNHVPVCVHAIDPIHGKKNPFYD